MEVNDFKENYGNGWIKLYRSIQNHWIWKDPIKFKWWIDILLSVNHSGKKVNIGYDIFDCNPGQTIMSLQNWSQRWNVSKDTVRNFFTLLKKDKMILTENLKKTTRLTVCNYDTYQSSLHVEQTQSKRKANAKQTQADPNKNDKNVKNEKEDINIQKEIIFKLQVFKFHEQYSKDMLDAFFYYWSEWNKSKTKMRYEIERTWDLSRRLKRWESNNFGNKKNGSFNKEIATDSKVYPSKGLRNPIL